jgi:16S rRNA C967 or C1407 C5-methylase (RsmB/RsmF family)
MAAAIERLAAKLFEDPLEQKLFVESVLDPKDLDSSYIWLRSDPPPFKELERFEGQPSFVYRTNEKVTRDRLHDEGALYSLDYSSVFAGSIVLATPKNPSLILDACAAPGGKSIFAWRALSPERLFSNEVVIGRAKALISNLKRCQIKNVRVLHQAIEQLAIKIPESADLVLLDVPCSGQSLMTKGKQVPGTFSPHVINGNVKRQRRILAHASQTVAPSGYIAYMTCTFAPDENEKNIDWFLKKFPDFEAVKADHLANFQSHLTETPCYRIWPHRHQVAGAFTALLRNKKEDSSSSSDIDLLKPIWQA